MNLGRFVAIPHNHADDRSNVHAEIINAALRRFIDTPISAEGVRDNALTCSERHTLPPH